jgi:hypothetical protein
VVDALPPAEQPLDLVLSVGRYLGAGYLPPLHQQPLVHRQLAPHVADGEHVVHPGVGDHHDVGRRRSLERGQESPGPRREHVGHRLGALGHPVHAELAAAARSPLARPG